MPAVFDWGTIWTDCAYSRIPTPSRGSRFITEALDGWLVRRQIRYQCRTSKAASTFYFMCWHKINCVKMVFFLEDLLRIVIFPKSLGRIIFLSWDNRRDPREIDLRLSCDRVKAFNSNIDFIISSGCGWFFTIGFFYCVESVGPRFLSSAHPIIYTRYLSGSRCGFIIITIRF